MDTFKNNTTYKILEKADFKCARCSRCCRHEPGVVFLSAEDTEKIALFLKIEIKDFIIKYCRKIIRCDKSVVALKEKKNYDCIFWNGGCEIYDVRPVQCITYPFWPFIVESEEFWESEARKCPGINSGGVLTIEEKINYFILEKNCEYMEYPK